MLFMPLLGRCAFQISGLIGPAPEPSAYQCRLPRKLESLPFYCRRMWLLALFHQELAAPRKATPLSIIVSAFSSESSAG